MSLFKKHSREYKIISKSKYFSKKWYLKMYPDVAESKMDPVKHYLEHGWKEGRNPSGDFNSQIYLQLNSDVKEENINPLVHYETYGIAEGRMISLSDEKKFSSFKLIKKMEKNICFNKYKKVDVSIIIPVYNNFKYTMLCLQSIYNNTTDVSYEVIIADDNSTDETVNIKKYVKNIKVVRNKTNLRFLKNCNNAAKEAEGEFICFLNNDTQVQKGWLKYLVDTIFGLYNKINM